jgi:ribonuclease HI
MNIIKGDPSSITHNLQFDGGSNPNPGPCAGAFVVYTEDKKNKIAEGGCFIPQGTNNIGEYTGLRVGLERCIALGLKHLHIEGDSLLVISQISGKWKVKNHILSVIHSEILGMFSHFETITARHIPREMNSYADSLSDKTLSLKHSW